METYYSILAWKIPRTGELAANAGDIRDVSLIPGS